jgi:hypothetical protein
MTAVVRKWVGGGQEGLHFWCPGCDEPHQIRTAPTGWGWNGDLVKPTFTPSVLVTSGHYAQGSDSQTTGECWCNLEARTGEKPHWQCMCCHSFVTDGRIQFLGDCTHALANQTVDLPAWPWDGLER